MSLSSNKEHQHQQQADQQRPLAAAGQHGDSDFAANDTVGIVWKNLTTWIHLHGGYVHPDLELRAIVVASSSSSSSLDDKKSDNNISQHHRGVFAKKAIAVNELLIRLPFRLAIHGNDPDRFPVMYHNYYSSCTSKNNKKQQQPTVATSSCNNDEDDSVPVVVETTSRATSAWLRCLAAYYYYSDNNDDGQNLYSMAPYFASLPGQYETVSAWTRDEIVEYLSGTTLCSGNTGGDLCWHAASDAALLRERYIQQIRPYLVHCQVLLPPPQQPTLLALLDTCKNEDYKGGDGIIAQDEFRRFTIATQCMSTRCFHLSKEQQHTGHYTTSVKPAAAATTQTAENTRCTPTNNNSNDDDDVYTGPFLLPVIDLLNHASCHEGEACVTTLVQCRDGGAGGSDKQEDASSSSFTMAAERSIAAGQEILHSYGNDLNASQFLQTFGFIPQATVERCIERMTTTTTTTTTEATTSSSLTPTINSSSNDNHGPAITPAFLSKTSILEACWSVIEDNDYPNQLTRIIQEKGMDDDETWTIQLDKTRNTDFIAENLLISYHPNNNDNKIVQNDDDDENNDESSIVTNELVTLACIPFLPNCAYAEVAQSLLGREILQDYFLGKLVCNSLLKAIRHKCASYKPIQSPFDNNKNGSSNKQQNDKGRDHGNDNDDDDDDVLLLRQLLDASRDDKSGCTTTNLNASFSTTRLMYGLTVRMEEKLSLRALRKEIMMILASLDDDDDEEEHTNSGYDNDEDHVDSTKRQKL